MLSHADALKSDSQGVQVALCDGTSLHHTHGADIFVAQVDPRCDDACREDPFGDVEGDVGLDFSRPAIEGEEIDGGEGIDSIDGN